jgi:hypothetical protein
MLVGVEIDEMFQLLDLFHLPANPLPFTSYSLRIATVWIHSETFNWYLGKFVPRLKYTYLVSGLMNQSRSILVALSA